MRETCAPIFTQKSLNHSSPGLHKNTIQPSPITMASRLPASFRAFSTTRLVLAGPHSLGSTPAAAPAGTSTPNPAAAANSGLARMLNAVTPPKPASTLPPKRFYPSSVRRIISFLPCLSSCPLPRSRIPLSCAEIKFAKTSSRPLPNSSEKHSPTAPTGVPRGPHCLVLDATKPSKTTHSTSPARPPSSTSSTPFWSIPSLIPWDVSRNAPKRA